MAQRRLKEASLTLAEVEAALDLPPNYQQLIASLKEETQTLGAQLQERIKEKQLAQSEADALVSCIPCLSHFSHQILSISLSVSVSICRFSLPLSAKCCLSLFLLFLCPLPDGAL